MGKRGHEPLTIQDFGGLQSLPRLFHDDEQSDSITLNGASLYKNGIVVNGQLMMRPSFLGKNEGVPNAVRMHNFKNEPLDQRHLVLGPGGKLYDDKYSTTTPILTIAGMIDFSVLVVDNRAYITPHTRLKGMASQFVYVWDPQIMTVARKAAGLKPTGTFTVAVSGTDGNTEPGVHVLAISWESNTGFITKPNLFVSVTAPSGTKKKIDLSVIPTAPPSAGDTTIYVARHILMSRVVRNPDGNLNWPHLYFAKKIEDNTTTALTGANGLSLFDTELVASADYLKDVLEEIPAGVSISLYGSRMAVGGEPKVNDQTPQVRVSQVGNYETFLATEGFLLAPRIGGGVKNLGEIRGFFYVFKSGMTFVTQDNGQSPNRWKVDKVDESLGCECFGLAQIPSSGSGLVKEGLLVNTYYGLFYFNGRYDDLPLTHQIGSEFAKLVLLDPATIPDVPAGFTGWQVAIDPYRRRIAIFVPKKVTDGTTEDEFKTVQVLHGDFSQGFTWDAARWSTWTFHDYITCMLIDLTQAFYPQIHLGTSRFTLKEDSLEVAEQPFVDRDGDAIDRAIIWEWISSDAVGLSMDGGRAHIETLAMRVATLGHGSQPFNVEVHQVDDGQIKRFAPVSALARVDTDKVNPRTVRMTGSAIAERFKVGLRYVSDIPPNNSGFRISKVHVYPMPHDEEVPK